MKTIQTPVRVEPGLRGNVVVIIGDNNEFIAEVYSEGRDAKQNVELADELTKRINMHDELVNSLKKMLDPSVSAEVNLEQMNFASRLINQAKGKQPKENT